MVQVSIDEVKPGMVLDRDVKNNHGQVLVRAGVELNHRHLTLLRSWGVFEVAIQGGGPSRGDLLDLQDIKPEHFALAEGFLRDKFALALSGDPVMKELFRHCVARKAKAMYG